LDEPTNDLDAETLELLEEQLMNFGGTLLLVSHDREFINNVATSSIVFENGEVNEYIGGYDDWLRQRKAPANKPTAKAAKQEKPKAVEKKLSYKDQKELDELPKKMEQLEKDIQAANDAMAEPGFYQREPAETNAVQAQLQQLESELEHAFERWETLESQ
jgi:ATP-binding cassette subfamily F protein uup